MPGNIAAATPSVVMPQSLCLSFAEAREYADLENVYHDGTRTVGLLTTTSRKSFRLSQRLTSTALATLKAFWDSLGGGLKPIVYYNPAEGSPVGSNYDPSGGSLTGRYFAVFRGNWSQSTEILRTVVTNIEIIEIN